MPPETKKRSRKSGLPPGSLVHIGRDREAEPKVNIIDYAEHSFLEESFRDMDSCALLRDKPTVTWTDIDGIQNVGLLEKLGGCYGLHPLVMEDILNTNQRPKVEDYGDYLYLVLKMLQTDARGAVTAEQISLVIGAGFLLSFQEGHQGDVFGSVRERLRNDKGRIRKLGTDYLAYSLIDAVVDNYFAVLERIGEQIEAIEERVVSRPSSELLRDIHLLKRELIYLRKSVWPLREVISQLQRGESPLISETTRLYLRDVYDHAIQVIDTVETYRDMVSGMLDIYLSSISNRMNSVMKVLTVIATIFMPLTFIAGVYGMNFKYMPELEWRYGYLSFWLVMLAIGISMLVYFRRKKWLE